MLFIWITILPLFNDGSIWCFNLTCSCCDHFYMKILLIVIILLADFLSDGLDLLGIWHAINGIRNFNPFPPEFLKRNGIIRLLVLEHSKIIIRDIKMRTWSSSANSLQPVLTTRSIILINVHYHFRDIKIRTWSANSIEPG